jgi:hypothetical protein
METAMTQTYDATKDPRTGRPIFSQPQQNGELAGAVKEARRLHHEEGIPPTDEPTTQFLDVPNSKPAAMKAPPGDWVEGDEESDEDDEAEDIVGESEEAAGAAASEDARPRTYQVRIENPSISVRDYELEASGTVNIEEYRGEELCGRITVEVTTLADQSLSIAEANPILLDSALKSLERVCELNPDILHRALVV